MTDPIADLLTRIRNALHARHDKVVIPGSKMKVAIVELLKMRGFVLGFRVVDGDVASTIEVDLRYSSGGAPVIAGLKRVSSPGCRVYGKAKDIKPVLGGRGLSIYSTPKGLLAGEDAKKLGVGGEFLCQVW